MLSDLSAFYVANRKSSAQKSDSARRIGGFASSDAIAEFFERSGDEASQIAKAVTDPGLGIYALSGFRAGAALLWLLLTACMTLTAAVSLAQQKASGGHGDTRFRFDTESVGPSRFVAVHGRRALIAGYATGGLEVWAYPFQIVSDYRVAFRVAGSTMPIPGAEILSRVTYEPDRVTRMYLGPDFIVRERLFVPLDQSGAIVTYEVESQRGVEIEVHATPVLNLMWPGALGGQSTAWNEKLSAYVLSEPEDGFSAAVGSAETLAHDDIVNRAGNGEGSDLGFTLHPDHAGVAHVVFALNPPHARDTGALFRKLIKDRQALEGEAAAHSKQFMDTILRVETPDAQVNNAIAWSEVALDQSWVCNVDLGCGFVAGYGPSRGARRPQYDWFFAGDGLVAADGAIDISDYALARKELEFILRYQDHKTGMIWHELSQSAGLIDWAGKFPYMFVHVDITFQFLATVEHYVATSGDSSFAREHWNEIESAYRYCQSVIDPASGLPVIPADKEGGDEQDRISDDLGLSTSWVQATSGFAHLASMTGHAMLADEASKASRVARASIPGRYWDKQQGFWIAGFNASRQAAPEQRSGPTSALELHLFSAKQDEQILDQLAGASFQTDWGTRSVSEGSPGYDPASYAKGSVWAVGTASLAETFWAEHRPASAMGMWNALLPWTTLDSPGHLDEVLAGNFYRPQTESVPEQTWSSAGFLDATIHGLFGLQVDASGNRIIFAPHLPVAWNKIAIEQIRLNGASVGLSLRRTAHGLALEIDNPGSPCTFGFLPELPLGAHLLGAKLNGRPAGVSLETHPQETNARIDFDVPHGSSKLELDFDGGVSVIAGSPLLHVGEPSSGVRIVGFKLAGHLLTIDADVPSDRESHLHLRTAWPIANAEGAAATATDDGDVIVSFAADKTSSTPYRRMTAVLTFKQ